MIISNKHMEPTWQDWMDSFNYRKSYGDISDRDKAKYISELEKHAVRNILKPSEVIDLYNVKSHGG